jgi:hypothetical protein
MVALVESRPSSPCSYSTSSVSITHVSLIRLSSVFGIGLCLVNSLCFIYLDIYLSRSLKRRCTRSLFWKLSIGKDWGTSPKFVFSKRRSNTTSSTLRPMRSASSEQDVVKRWVGELEFGTLEHRRSKRSMVTTIKNRTMNLYSLLMKCKVKRIPHEYQHLHRIISRNCCKKRACKRAVFVNFNIFCGEPQ